MPTPKHPPAAKSALKAIAKPVAKATVVKAVATKSASKAPVKPVAKIVAKAPAKPVAKAPAKPVAKAPAKPVAKAPAKPVAKAPAKPVAKAPAKPVAKAPAKPVAKAPVKPVAKVVPTKPTPAAKAAAAPAKAAAAPVKAAPAAKIVAAPKPTPEPKVAPAKSTASTGTKPESASPKPAVEKRLMPTKMENPVVSSKVMKMTKANEAANALANLKCPFNKEELSQWRSLLMGRRSEISNDIEALEKDAMEAEDGHTTPLHAAERGSDADLQDVSLGLAGEEKDLVWQIDRALRKIDLASPIPFGICEYTKEPISRQRLQLIPWTPLSIEGATYMEENGMIIEDIILDD